LPFTVYRLPFAVCRLPFTVCRLPFTVYRLPFAVYRLPFTVCRFPVGRCPTLGYVGLSARPPVAYFLSFYREIMPNGILFLSFTIYYFIYSLIYFSQLAKIAKKGIQNPLCVKK